MVFDDDDDGEDKFDEAVVLDEVALLEVAGAEDEFDGAVIVDDDVAVLVLLDEETCGAEGVAAGVGESA